MSMTDAIEALQVAADRAETDLQAERLAGIAALLTRQQAVIDKAEELMYVMAQWRAGGYQAEGCRVAEQNLKDTLAALKGGSRG